MEQDYEVGVAFLLSHSNPPLDALLGRYLGFKYKMCANINVAFCSTWCQTTAVVNRAQLAADVVNCCKQSATLRTCCSQSSSIVLTMLKSKRRQAGFYLQCKILVSFWRQHGQMYKTWNVASIPSWHYTLVYNWAEKVRFSSVKFPSVTITYCHCIWVSSLISCFYTNFNTEICRATAVMR